MTETTSDPQETRTPRAVSPLVRGAGAVSQGWEGLRGLGPATGVQVVDLSSWTKVQVRSDDEAVAEAMGVRFGRRSRSGEELLVGSGPGEWLVLAAPGSGAELVSRLTDDLAPAFVTVIDQTHGRALMRVQGPGTAALLRRLTAMDLDDRFVPDGAAFRTSLARVVTDMVRDDVDGEPSYLLHCERSSGRYLADCLLEAGEDLGAELVGATPSWPA